MASVVSQHALQIKKCLLFFKQIVTPFVFNLFFYFCVLLTFCASWNTEQVRPDDDDDD